MMPAVPSPPDASRSTTTTLAPSLANPSAVARPMPLPAPVISATLPLKSMVSSAFQLTGNLARMASAKELEPRLLQAGPDIGPEGSRYLDAEGARCCPPQDDLRLSK